MIHNTARAEVLDAKARTRRGLFKWAWIPLLLAISSLLLLGGLGQVAAGSVSAVAFTAFTFLWCGCIQTTAMRLEDKAIRLRVFAEDAPDPEP